MQCVVQEANYDSIPNIRAFAIPYKGCFQGKVLTAELCTQVDWSFLIIQMYFLMPLSFQDYNGPSIEPDCFLLKEVFYVLKY